MICWCRAQVIVHLTRLINSKTTCLGRHCYMYQFTNLHRKQWDEQHLRKPSFKLKQTLLCASFKQVWIKTNNSRSLNSPLAYRIDVMGYINWQLTPKMGKTPLTLLLVIEPWNIIWLQCQRVVVGVARKQCYRDIAGLLDGRLGIVEEVVGALDPQERVKVHLETVQDTDLLPGFKRLNW